MNGRYEWAMSQNEGLFTLVRSRKSLLVEEVFHVCVCVYISVYIYIYVYTSPLYNPYNIPIYPLHMYIYIYITTTPTYGANSLHQSKPCSQPWLQVLNHHMSCSLNSLRGGYIGDYCVVFRVQGAIYRGVL